MSDQETGEQRTAQRRRRARRDDGADANGTEVAPGDASAEHPAENGAGEGTAATEKPTENGRAPRSAPPPPKKVIYLVRLPKPEKEDARVSILRTKFDALLSGLKVMNEAVRVKRMELADVYEKLRVERDRLEAAIREYDEKNKVLIPLEVRLKRQRDEFRDLRDKIKSMEVKSEEELDQKLADLEYSIQHETMSLNDEKKILQRIKKLQESRPTLREFREKQAAVEMNHTEREELTAVVGDLKQEADILRNERDLAYEGVKKYSRERDVLKKQIDAISTEREELSAKKDAAYEDMRKVIDEQRDKDNDFYRALKARNKAKELVESGQVEEAERMCKEQVADVLGKFFGDKEFREEYIRLGELQRGRRINAADVEEELRAIKVDPKSLPTQVQPVDPDGGLSPRSRAQAIIDRIIGESEAAKASATATPAEPEPEPAPEPARAKKGGKKEAAAAPAAVEVTAAPVAKPRFIPPPQPVAMPVMAHDLEFQLPADLLKSGQKLSEAELKAQRREAALRAAQEAESRKVRQQENKVKKEKQRVEREKRLLEERAAARRAGAAQPNQFDQLEATLATETEPEDAGASTQDEAPKPVAAPVIPAAVAARAARAPGAARRRPYKEKKERGAASVTEKGVTTAKKVMTMLKDGRVQALVAFVIMLIAILALSAQ